MVIFKRYCNFSSGTITVRAGSSNRRSGGQLFNVSKVIKHSQFDPMSYDYDFCLLQLEFEIELNSTTTKPVNLPMQDDQIEKNCVLLATGFGQTEMGATTDLHGVILPVFDFEICAKKYDTLDRTYILTENMFCAGFDDDIRKTFKGDSGSPLVTLDNGIMYGITSWGNSNKMSKFPRVFAKVSGVVDWIKNFVYLARD